MPLSWNEIRNRAIDFSHLWSGTSREEAEAKSFLDAFFNVFGISRKRVATFEYHVKKLDGKDGYIDLLWKGKLLVEFKSLGKDLEGAYAQARDYFPGLKDSELPDFILLCDFDKFRLIELATGEEQKFALQDLSKNIRHFSFIAGYDTQRYREQNPADIKAARLMGALHDELKAIGYVGHDLEVLLVRLLFALFADDTNIFSDTKPFQLFITDRTAEDGSDLAARLNELFEVLNQPESKRLSNLDEQLAEFPYVNGKLFEERIRTASFSRKMRAQLIQCCEFNWSQISPAIFGALFQSIMVDKDRRNFGAHYTSEKNILKLIKPLFLDELREEFERIKKNAPKLRHFHDKLRSLTFFDPACGCGNFLVITYRELRLIELDVLRALRKSDQLSLDLSTLVRIDVDQFYGVEIEEWPAQIAQVAMWLVDHQMNDLTGSEFGQYFARIPLRKSAKIVIANALQIDWERVVEKEKLSYILGNPPFIGKQFQNDSQRKDLDSIFNKVSGAKVLDYVCGWYLKAARLMRDTNIRCAFVSTNSITQGEQVGILWNKLLKLGVRIFFAHRTFSWNNEASGMAAVHCVIIGFSEEDLAPKVIFDYQDIKGEPHASNASEINPYLVDAPNVALPNRNKPISAVPEILFGSKPTDGGNLIMLRSERDALLQKEPQAAKFIRTYMSAEDYIHNIPRYCLWLKDCDPSELAIMPFVLERVKAVRRFRESSSKLATVRDASKPMVFAEDRQPLTDYLAIPKTSSERRQYIPIGFMSSDVVVASELFTIANATPWHFGVLSSSMHMAWVRAVCGRLKSDYRYSAGIVYNNFPWPEKASIRQRQLIESAAQVVLDIRAQYQTSSLAHLYDPHLTPPVLVKAHQELNCAVDGAYGKKSFATESARVAFLFEEYQKLVVPLMELTPRSKAK